mgnify:FL=1
MIGIEDIIFMPPIFVACTFYKVYRIGRFIFIKGKYLFNRIKGKICQIAYHCRNTKTVSEHTSENTENTVSTDLSENTENSVSTDIVTSTQNTISCSATNTHTLSLTTRTIHLLKTLPRIICNTAHKVVQYIKKKYLQVLPYIKEGINLILSLALIIGTVIFAYHFATYVFATLAFVVLVIFLGSVVILFMLIYILDQNR